MKFAKPFLSFHIDVQTAYLGPSLKKTLAQKTCLAELAALSNFERLKLLRV